MNPVRPILNLYGYFYMRKNRNILYRFTPLETGWLWLPSGIINALSLTGFILMKEGLTG